MVNKFSHLGGIVSLQGGAQEITRTLLGRFKSAFAKLQSLCGKTKIRIYQSNVLFVHLYGPECWGKTQQDTNILASYHALT